MKKYLICVLFLLTVYGFVNAQSNLDTVATVDGKPITVKELKDMVNKLEKGTGRTLTIAERKDVLDMMINERLAMQEAERLKIIVSDAEINAQIQEMKKQLAQMLGHQPSDAEFSKAIQEQTGMDLATFRAEGKKDATLQRLIVQTKGDRIQAIQKTWESDIESEVKKEYSLNSSKYVQNDTVRFSAIVFEYKANNKSKVKEEAYKMLKEIAGDPNIFDEKVQKGTLPNSTYKSTNSGILEKTSDAEGQFGSEFVDAAFKLAQGKVSDLLDVDPPSAKQNAAQSERAFFIIKIKEKYLQKFLALDDILIAQNATLHDYLAYMINQRKQIEILRELSEELARDLRKKNSSITIIDKNLNYQ
ncbi:MAG: hypothetical protein Ta2F_12880 [Termitinemataceae bacterium]|nr:MAG: hypothetical protein Ta2F_12880 [Termitinemataceae bacterium]